VPPTVRADSAAAFLVGSIAEGTNTLRPQVHRLTAVSISAPRQLPAAKWALGALALKKRESGAFQDLVAAVDGANVLHVSGGGERWRIRESGADFALVDLNDSGRADVVYSSAALPGAPDAVSVRSLLAKGRSKRLWSHRWPGSVRVLGAGDMDNDGRSEVVLATGRRLWVLRELSR